MSPADLLREALRTHAEFAPPSGALLSAVQDRVRRRRKRRLAAGVVVAAVAVLVVPVAARGILPASGAEAEPLLPVEQPTPAPAPPSGATTLVPAAASEPPAFPFTPTWTPSGLVGPSYEYTDYSPLVDREPDGSLATYRLALTYYGRSSGQQELSVSVQDNDSRPALDKLRDISQSVDEDEPEGGMAPLSEQQVTIQDRVAVLLSNDQMAVVSWQHAQWQWVTVHGRTVGEVLQYAEGLAEQPLPSQVPFTVELLPAGAALESTYAHRMSFIAEEPLPDVATNAVEVELRRGGPGMSVPCPSDRDGLPPIGDPYQTDDPDECSLPREPVQVGGQDAELVGEEVVLVFLDGGLALTVAAHGALALSRADLLSFAGSIRLTSHARPSTQ